MTGTAALTLVTGATGFAGRHLLRRLAGTGPVVGWHRPTHAPAPLDGVTWAGVDLLDRAAVLAAVAAQPPSRAFHLAGASHVGDSWGSSTDHLAVHVRGTEHLLEAIRACAPEARVLVVSSGMVYRVPPADGALTLSEEAPLGPASPYALSKLAEEQLALHVARTDGLAVIVARPFNHIGPGQAPTFAASSFARQIAAIEAGLAPGTLSVGNLETERDLSDVRDVVAAYEAILARGRTGAIYNVCTGRAVRMSAVLDHLLAAARAAVTRSVDPARLRPNDLPTLCGDPARTMRETGWTPTIPLVQTLDDLLDDWRRRLAVDHRPA